jgi:hypothetical protein
MLPPHREVDFLHFIKNIDVDSSSWSKCECVFLLLSLLKKSFKPHPPLKGEDGSKIPSKHLGRGKNPDKGAEATLDPIASPIFLYSSNSPVNIANDRSGPTGLKILSNRRN